MNQTTFQIPDYEKIKIAVLEKDSGMYIEDLLNLFNSEPENMTFEQMQYLYYGYMYSEMFASGKHLYEEVEKPEKTTLLKNFYNYYQELFDVYQFHIGELRTASIVALMNDDIRRYNLWLNQSNRLLEIIKASGDGSEKYPYHVISISNEYDIVDIECPGSVISQTYDNGIDHLCIDPDFTEPGTEIKTVCFYAGEFIDLTASIYNKLYRVSPTQE